MERKEFEHLQEINKHFTDVLSNLSFLNKVGFHEENKGIAPYIVKLALLPVSAKSVFRDMLWDFDAESANRSASVRMSHVQINFGSYTHIPLGIITEIKCLLLNIYTTPKDFGHQKNEIKPNTFIGVIKDGLAFLDFVLNEVEGRLGKEYVKEHYSNISDISLLDFEDAVKKTKLKISSDKKLYNSYKYFFGYLRNHKAKELIGIECQADYHTLKKCMN